MQEIDKLKRKLVLLSAILFFFLILTSRLIVMLNDNNVNYNNIKFITNNHIVSIMFDANSYYVNKAGFGSVTGYNILHNNLLTVAINLSEYNSAYNNSKVSSVTFYTKIKGVNTPSYVNKNGSDVITNILENYKYYQIEITSLNHKTPVDKKTIQKILTSFEVSS
jgi:hypothetical protein